MPPLQPYQQHSGAPLAAVVLILSLASGPVASIEPGHAPDIDPEVDAEAWLDADDPDAAEVNEGELVFFATPPAGGPFHHHQNRLTVSKDSLSSGWVKLEQCHANLDAVPRTEIAFRAGRVRDLSVMASHAIGRAWVEDNSVQLSDVKHGARLCLNADLKVLAAVDEARWQLRSGPYMRRFFDGYYTMRVSLRMELLAPEIRVTGITPRPTQGFTVRQSAQVVEIDGLFTGKLAVEIDMENAP